MSAKPMSVPEVAQHDSSEPTLKPSAKVAGKTAAVAVADDEVVGPAYPPVAPAALRAWEVETKHETPAAVEPDRRDAPEPDDENGLTALMTCGSLLTLLVAWLTALDCADTVPCAAWKTIWPP